MLVLTRKANEEIIISDNIVIKVLKTTSNQVKFGVTAPRDVSIQRSEILEKDSTNGCTQEKSNVRV